MSTASRISDEPRQVCRRCRQAATHCWCALVEPQTTRAGLVLLQHPREARNPVGTARMAHLAVPGSHLLVGIDFAEDPDFRRLFDEHREHSVVLFPAPGARDLRELAERPDPLMIWAIDGTWWQAGKLWRSNPVLATLPAYRIEPRQPSCYVIRSEPAPHCLSTVEAIAEVLDAVDGAPGAHAGMTRPLHALVERQLSWSQGAARTPRRRVRAGSRRPAGPLAGKLDRVLLVHAEGNGWPANHPDAPRPELLQWVATRPATGERFGALVRPTAGLSPTVTQHTGLSEAELRGGLEPAEFVERWRRFVRDDDLLCAWGHFPFRLLAGAGAGTPPSVDLRPVVRQRLEARMPSIENACALAEATAEPARFPGRGGGRLAMLEALFARLFGDTSG